MSIKYFFSVKREQISQYKIKRSEFIVHLKFADSIDLAKAYISEIAAQHRTASHNCWAFIVGKTGETFHSSDAGEPAGTAGKPILNALKKNDLNNIAAVVTRYFGGVKLGVRGLIEAYGNCVEKTIAESELKKLIELKKYRITCSYESMEKLKYQLQKLDADCFDFTYSEKVDFTAGVEIIKQKPVETYLNENQKIGLLSYLPISV